MRLLNNPAQVTMVIGVQNWRVFHMNQIGNTHDVNWVFQTYSGITWLDDKLAANLFWPNLQTVSQVLRWGKPA